MFLSSGRAPARNGSCGHPCSLHLLLSVLALIFLLPPVIARAQMGTDMTGTGGKHSIQGRIYFPSGRRSDAGGVRVRLQSTNSGDLSVMADINGNFAFRGLSPGSYTVVIEGTDDYETASDSVFIDTEAVTRKKGTSPIPISRPYTVLIYLQPKRNTGGTKSKPGVINAALANVPAQARDLYLQALESIKAGDTRKAVEQLRSAVTLYPSFALAFNELGVQYLKLNQADKAAEALSQAVRLTPDVFALRLNYGIALWNAKKYSEARTELGEALKKSAVSPVAHYYLGLTLLNLNSYDEAEKELLRSVELGGDGMSMAHYYLGGIYWRKKDYERAITQLEAYLRTSPKAADAERVRATIASLRSKM